MSRLQPRGIDRVQILATALLFSTGGAAIKACSLTAWQVASFRSGIAAVALMLFLPESRRFLARRQLIVGLAYAATMVLYVTANKLTTAANAIFLQSTAPLYVLLLGPRLLGERARATDLGFAAALCAGMTLFFVGVESPQITAPDPFSGNVLGVASGLSWALTIVGLRWLGRMESSPGGGGVAGAVVGGNLIAALICLPLALPVTRSVPTDWALVVYLGVFQIGAAYALMTRGLRRVPAFEVALLLLLEPVLSVVWAWLVHGEQPGPWSLAGCLTVLSATVWRAISNRS